MCPPGPPLNPPLPQILEYFQPRPCFEGDGRDAMKLGVGVEDEGELPPARCQTVITDHELHCTSF